MIDINKEIQKVFENALNKPATRARRLVDGAMGDKRYQVDTGEIWGYARWPAIVSVTNGFYQCYGSQCLEIKSRHSEFMCKHIRGLRKLLNIS